MVKSLLIRGSWIIICPENVVNASLDSFVWSGNQEITNTISVPQLQLLMPVMFDIVYVGMWPHVPLKTMTNIGCHSKFLANTVIHASMSSFTISFQIKIWLGQVYIQALFFRKHEFRALIQQGNSCQNIFVSFFFCQEKIISSTNHGYYFNTWIQISVHGIGCKHQMTVLFHDIFHNFETEVMNF